MTNRGLTQMIYNFLRKLGVTNVKVAYNTKDFCCTWEEEDKFTINYNINDIEESVILGYVDFFKKNYNKVPYCTMFTFSLLHELGHCLTLPEANENYCFRSFKAKQRISEKVDNQKITLRQAQYYYCGLYVERIANDKAVEILNNNYEIIKSFDEKLKRYLTK
jgi:hypothetical protein